MLGTLPWLECDGRVKTSQILGQVWLTWVCGARHESPALKNEAG